MIVVDSSAIITLAMADEDAVLGEAALREIVADGGVVPALFWYEIRNILLVCERRGRKFTVSVDDFLADVDTLGLIIDTAPNSDRTMALARKHQLTFYDAIYLELMLRCAAPIASLDQPLCKAVLAEGGELVTV